jgi:hypothetical protein
MRGLLGGLLAASLVLGAAPRAFSAACALSASDLQAKRATYDAACAAMSPPAGCATASTHGQYVKCISAQEKADTTLPTSCRGAVKKCAAKSTCGKSGFVTCCRTKSTGATKCSTKSSAAACKPPKGGTACVGNHPSCCDACTATGCASPSGAFLDGGF